MLIPLGGYADGSHPDWRTGLAVLIFIVLLCMAGLAMLGASAGISLLIGEGAFPLVLIGVIALVLQLVKRW